MDAAGDESSRPRLSRRSWADWVSEHPKTVAAVAVLVLLVGAWLFVDALGRQRLRRAERAIIARGEPLTVDDLRKRLPAISDDENMAIGLAEHGARILDVDSTSPTNSASLPIFSNAKPVVIGVRWPPEQDAAAHWFCEQNAAAIEGIKAACELSNGLYPIRWASPAINILLPQLPLHRKIVKSLAVAALAAAHDGRPAECVRHLAAATATDRAIRHEPFVISMLVRLACVSLTCDTAL